MPCDRRPARHRRVASTSVCWSGELRSIETPKTAISSLLSLRPVFLLFPRVAREHCAPIRRANLDVSGVKRKYTDHPDVLFKASVLQRERADYNVFLMKDEISVEQAVNNGATRLADVDVTTDF